VRRPGQQHPWLRRIRARFFSCDRLFQGADFRLQLRNFLLIASFRFPAFADFLGSLNGLTFPVVTTADNLGVLKHWLTGTRRGVDSSGIYQVFAASSSVFLMSFIIRKPRMPKPAENS
jgi:hypothetical protein